MELIKVSGMFRCKRYDQTTEYFRIPHSNSPVGEFLDEVLPYISRVRQELESELRRRELSKKYSPSHK